MHSGEAEPRDLRRDPFQHEGVFERPLDPARIDLGPAGCGAPAAQPLPIGPDLGDRRGRHRPAIPG